MDQLGSGERASSHHAWRGHLVWLRGGAVRGGGRLKGGQGRSLNRSRSRMVERRGVGRGTKGEKAHTCVLERGAGSRRWFRLNPGLRVAWKGLRAFLRVWRWMVRRRCWGPWLALGLCRSRSRIGLSRPRFSRRWAASKAQLRGSVAQKKLAQGPERLARRHRHRSCRLGRSRSGSRPWMTWPEPSHHLLGFACAWQGVEAAAGRRLASCGFRIWSNCGFRKMGTASTRVGCRSLMRRVNAGGLLVVGRRQEVAGDRVYQRKSHCEPSAACDNTPRCVAWRTACVRSTRYQAAPLSRNTNCQH